MPRITVRCLCSRRGISFAFDPVGYVIPPALQQRTQVRNSFFPRFVPLVIGEVFYQPTDFFDGKQLTD